jgi:hypothetical protein
MRTDNHSMSTEADQPSQVPEKTEPNSQWRERMSAADPQGWYWILAGFFLGISVGVSFNNVGIGVSFGLLSAFAFSAVSWITQPFRKEDDEPFL